jgi:hypothetical protein
LSSHGSLSLFLSIHKPVAYEATPITTLKLGRFPYKLRSSPREKGRA